MFPTLLGIFVEICDKIKIYKLRNGVRFVSQLPKQPFSWNYACRICMFEVIFCHGKMLYSLTFG